MEQRYGFLARCDNIIYHVVLVTNGPHFHMISPTSEVPGLSQRLCTINYSHFICSWGSSIGKKGLMNYLYLSSSERHSPASDVENNLRVVKNVLSIGALDP